MSKVSGDGGPRPSGPLAKRRTVGTASARRRATLSARPRHRLAGETVYGVLKHEITTGVHAGGVRLREQDLSERFGVSRTPVREALKRLSAEGLVAVDAGNGLVVRAHSVDEVLDSYVVHGVVQALAARLAAERASEVDLFRLETLLEDGARALDDGEYEQASELTTRFEHTLRDVARNSKLSAVIEFLHNTLAPTKPSDGTVRLREQLDEHRAIVRAIKARDPLAAEQASNLHTSRSRDHRMTTLLRVNMERPRT